MIPYAVINIGVPVGGLLLGIFALRHFLRAVPAGAGAAAAACLAVLAFAEWFESVWAPPAAARLGAVAVVLVAAFGATLRAPQEGDESARILPGLLAFTLALYLGTVNALKADEASTVQIVGRFLPALVWLALAYLAARRRITIELLAWGVVAVFGFAAAAGRLTDPWQACSVFKCSSYGELYSGIFESENSFAKLACMAAVISFATRSRFAVILTATITTLVLVGSTSRTSAASVVLALVIAFLMRRQLSRSPSLLPRLVVPAVSIGAVFLGTYLAYTAGPSDFSDRGYIWGLARQAVSGAFISGNGIDNWLVHVLARNYMHSQVMFLLYAGGAAAYSLYLLWIVTVSRSALRYQSLAPIAVVVLAATVGVLEVSLNFVAIDGTSLYVAVLVVIGSAVPISQQAGVTRGGSANSFDEPRRDRVPS